MGVAGKRIKPNGCNNILYGCVISHTQGYDKGRKQLAIATCGNQDPLQATTGEFRIINITEKLCISYLGQN